MQILSFEPGRWAGARPRLNTSIFPLNRHRCCAYSDAKARELGESLALYPSQQYSDAARQFHRGQLDVFTSIESATAAYRRGMRTPDEMRASSHCAGGAARRCPDVGGQKVC